MKLIRSLSYVRLALVPLALIKLLLDRDDFPTAAYERAAWTLLGLQVSILVGALSSAIVIGFTSR